MRDLFLLIISIAFVLLGGFLIFKGGDAEAVSIGWTCVLFFGGCAAIGAVEVFERARPPRPLLTSDSLRVTTNRIRMIIIGVASALWLSVGVLGLGSPTFPDELAWPITIFGGIAALTAFALALNGGAKIVVDREGIADFRQLKAKAPWDDVYAVGIEGGAGPPFVFVWLRQPERYKDKQTQLARLLRRRIDPLQILDVELAGNAYDIMEAVRQFAPERVWRQRLLDPNGPRR
jgi:hypothetical protein